MRFCKKLLVTCVPFVLATFAVQAGPFSRARTEGHRLDDGKPVAMNGLYVYSFLQEGVGDDQRLSKDIDKYLGVVIDTLQQRGARAAIRNMPAGTLILDTTSSGIQGFERTLDASAKAGASAIAREYRDVESALPAGYRLLLLPDKVVRNSGLQWGTRKIGAGPGTWFTHGAQATGVPSYSFRVYWLLENVDDQPIAAGTTTGTLDIRGFPAKPMAEQMVAELEKLGIGWQGLAN